jgi:hypothetical protein
MAQGDPITATEHNNLRGVILPVVNKYGRTPTSADVVGGSTPGVSDTVTEQQYIDLFKDAQACYVHQTNSVSTDALITQFAEGTLIEYSDITDLNLIASDISAFSPNVSQDFPTASFSQATLLTNLGVSTASTRDGSTNPWNTRIRHRVTVNFASSTAFNAFFNAGGMLKWSGSLTGGTSGTVTSKDGDWARILNLAGEIQIGADFTSSPLTFRTISANSNGTGSNVAITSLSTSTAQDGGTLIYTISGGYVSGGGQNIYVNNEFELGLAVNNASNPTALTIEARFNDDDTGTGFQIEPGEAGAPVDESVTGLLTSTFYTFTPDSEFTISATTYPAIQQTAPVGTVNSNL